MRTVVLLDVTIADTNMGNSIIMRAVEKHLRDVLRDAFFVRIPSFDRLGRVSRELLRNADLVFLCGGNTLTAHLWLFKPWRINMMDAWSMRGKVITIGVGWLRHRRLSESWMKPDWYTRALYKVTLSNQFIHSVRDSYAEQQMRQMGLSVINTGCPSLWSLSSEHSKTIPIEKGKRVVTTLTSYRKDYRADKILFGILRGHYEKVFFWPQQPGDVPYAREVLGDEWGEVEVVQPSLEALDELLTSDASLDYVGTRLHAYIRAVQLRRRSINVGVDDRALEMAKDFNLTVIPRGEWQRLEELIEHPFETQIRVPEERIRLWKEQFRRYCQ